MTTFSLDDLYEMKRQLTEMGAAPSSRYVLVATEAFVIKNWPTIKSAPDNPLKKIETPEKWIEKMKTGKYLIGGDTRLIFQETLG